MKTPLHLLAQAQPAPTGTAVPSSDDRSTAFRPVQGGTELRSGEQLLVMAYAAIWLVVLAMVLLSWRRQQKIEERVTELEGALARARAAEKKAGREGGKADGKAGGAD
jgi:CcmD family protein